MKTVKILLIFLAVLILSADAFATTVSMPNLTGEAAATVEIPVSIDNAVGVAAFNITVTYDPLVLNCTTMLKGSLISTGWDSLTSNVQSGQIYGTSNSSDLSELGGVSGNLVLIQCTVLNNPGAGTTLHIVPFPGIQLTNGLGDNIPITLDDGSFTINGGCVPSAEVCDGADNDCDGQVDENIAAIPTTCGIGACAKTGEKTCQGGQMVDNCTPGTPQTEGPYSSATCSDGIDNDCDGTTDAADTGCAQQCTPSAEVCDGADNDCDGQVDENIAAIPTTCGVGACAKTGQKTCQGGQMVDSCTPGTPQTEGPYSSATCSDGIDNDCDGSTDAADTGCAQQCTPSAEVCDGIDNDCDGQVDNGIAAVRTTCGIGACAKSGQKTCQGGQMVDSCTPGTPQTEGPYSSATCSDGIDNDCDSLTDAADTGCAQQCTPSAEVCDGADNDCNGQVDENLTRPTTCGIGVCANTGIETCSAGAWGGNSCTPGTPQTEGPFGDATCSDQIDNDCDGSTDAADTGCAQQCTPSTEVCDGADNDCNGQVDENLTRPTTCGAGVCANTGIETCSAGAWGSNSCTPGTPQTEGPFGDATCSDQIDNDCDGSADAADSDCAAPPLDMSQWIGRWFTITGSMKGRTFADKNNGKGYVQIWGWDPDTKTLHFDYFEFIKNEGVWVVYTDTLHFFGGTDQKLLFWHNRTVGASEVAFSGVIEGKVKNGNLQDGTIRIFGGVYSKEGNENTLYYNNTVNTVLGNAVIGKMIDAAKVPVPANVIPAH